MSSTIPWPLPSPTADYYIATAWNGSQQICFPEEPTSTIYVDQCYVQVKPSLMNDQVTESLSQCCLGRLDVVEGCGYQCVSNYTQDGEIGAVRLWWSKCVQESPLNGAYQNMSMWNPQCAVNHSMAPKVGATLKEKLFGVLVAVGVVFAFG
ncbi:hypothetical protein ABW20_dc0108842 [Dactylellina cionopaga]|nr:hypothetical protein ABW20_dc0108842 [Dactylellina cionopaga]